MGLSVTANLEGAALAAARVIRSHLEFDHKAPLKRR
jgi:hypothetical protein